MSGKKKKFLTVILVILIMLVVVNIAIICTVLIQNAQMVEITEENLVRFEYGTSSDYNEYPSYLNVYYENNGKVLSEKWRACDIFSLTNKEGLLCGDSGYKFYITGNDKIAVIEDSQIKIIDDQVKSSQKKRYISEEFLSKAELATKPGKDYQSYLVGGELQWEPLNY